MVDTDNKILTLTREGDDHAVLTMHVPDDVFVEITEYIEEPKQEDKIPPVDANEITQD